MGELALELPIEVHATKADFLASLREPHGQVVSWSMHRMEVGGFVGRTVPVASKLGADVSVATVVPVPCPVQFGTFFDKFALDRRYVTAIPGPCPTRIRARCFDGKIVVSRRGIASIKQPCLPSAALKVDAALVELAGSGHHEAMIDQLRNARRTHVISDRPVVGLRANGRWRPRRGAFGKPDRTWTFLRRTDARMVGQSMGGAHVAADENALLRFLHEQSTPSKVVLQLGSRGAVLINGVPCPYYVHTCPVLEKNGTGAGETLLTVTTLSSACGADDRTSLRRAVAAASGAMAGLELPRTLEELDV